MALGLDFKDWLVAFMLLIIILMVLDRMYHDSRWGGYGQSRKLRDAEYLEKHGFVGRRIVQMPKWEGRPPVPESMKRPLQKEERHDNKEITYPGNDRDLDSSSSREQSKYSERDSFGERRQSSGWDSED